MREGEEERREKEGSREENIRGIHSERGCSCCSVSEYGAIMGWDVTATGSTDKDKNGQACSKPPAVDPILGYTLGGALGATVSNKVG